VGQALDASAAAYGDAFALLRFCDELISWATVERSGQMPSLFAPLQQAAVPRVLYYIFARAGRNVCTAGWVMRMRADVVPCHE